MKYNVLSFITNTQNQYSASVVATHDDLSSAKVSYHNLCAALENADDVKLACVKLVNEYGNEVAGYFEMVDHRPAEAETE